MSSLVLEVGGREIEVSHPDKMLFPEAGVRKKDLCAYYRRIGSVMRTHVEGRIVSMHRFPDGLGGTRFFQKSVPGHFPDWIHTVEVDKEDGTLRQVVLDHPATLVYLADQACITPHSWLSRHDDRRRPDRFVFDLDPSGEADFGAVRWAARAVRDLFEAAGLRPFLMTTGSRGLHVVAPLVPRASFDRSRAVARGLADLLAARHPERLTVEQRKKKRGDRIFLDTLRNGYAQTSVPPYAVRARPGAPVATPIGWHELSGVGPRTYDVGNLFRRLGQKEDPWGKMGEVSETLEAAVGLLAERGVDLRS